VARAVEHHAPKTPITAFIVNSRSQVNRAYHRHECASEVRLLYALAIGVSI
jgi:hypothetical protein